MATSGYALLCLGYSGGLQKAALLVLWLSCRQLVADWDVDSVGVAE